MEANDVFAHKMQIRWPEAATLILRAAHRAQIRGQRVEPDVKNVLLFAGNRNAPANRRARNAQIAKAALDEAQNFVAARFRLNKGRIFPVQIQQRLLKRGKLEEII